VIDEQTLTKEAAALHHALFGREVPEELARHYAAAHAHVLSKVTAAEQAWMARALSRRTDIEAIETVVRLMGHDHVLTRKMRLLAYLAEAWPAYYRDFVNDAPGRGAAWCALAWHGSRTIVKFLKGWLIIKARGL
jgi:hypothetical protein